MPCLLFGRHSGGFEQRGQVVLQVTVIGKARLLLGVECDLNVVVLHLQCAGETDQSAQRALGKVLRFLFRERRNNACRN